MMFIRRKKETARWQSTRVGSLHCLRPQRGGISDSGPASRSRTREATRTTQLLRDEGGSWTVDGRARPDLAGCTDIDLEASVVTNTLPIHRLVENPGVHAVKAVYVRSDCTVDVLDQTYDIPVLDASRFSCAYTAPRFDFTAELRYDETGLILDYPGLAVRDVGA